VTLQPGHRARRFLSSLVAGPPAAADVAWAHRWLSAAEATLFDRMAPVDRRHAIGVARAVAGRLDRVGLDPGDTEDPEVRWVVAAALLHDVGKQVAGLGTYGRTVATLSGWVGGRGMAASWADTRGLTRRVGLYLQYEDLGGDQLAVAGSDPRVIAWTREHHRPESEWSVPVAVGRLLAEADDGR
jgi:hypothetical protein